MLVFVKIGINCIDCSKLGKGHMEVPKLGLDDIDFP